MKEAIQTEEKGRRQKEQPTDNSAGEASTQKLSRPGTQREKTPREGLELSKDLGNLVKKCEFDPQGNGKHAGSGLGEGHRVHVVGRCLGGWGWRGPDWEQEGRPCMQAESRVTAGGWGEMPAGHHPSSTAPGEE